jgi:hypothetical protein
MLHVSDIGTRSRRSSYKARIARILGVGNMDDKVTKSFTLVATMLNILVVLVGGLWFMFEVKADLRELRVELVSQARDLDKVIQYLDIWTPDEKRRP